MKKFNNNISNKNPLTQSPCICQMFLPASYMQGTLVTVTESVKMRTYL